MKKPMFSIITPLYIYDEKRQKDFSRCLDSVQMQSNQDFEHIVVDQSDADLSFIQEIKTVKYFHQEHLERLFALRKGFEEAKGEWFCLLDSDDIYLPHYLETVAQMIMDNPDQKLFNFGSIHIHKDGIVNSRDPFEPEWNEKEGRHEIFGGGTIVNGTFVFHRSVWEELGDFPKIEKLWNPWDFSIAFQEEFPEIKSMFTVDHPDHPEGLAKELGNPWGQDYQLFYRYTRKYRSMPFKKHLYGVYCK